MRPNVFLSAPSVLDRSQGAVRHQWCDALAARGFDVVSLDRSGYASDPWEPLIRLIGVSDGVLVLGLRQLAIHDGAWRAGTAEEVAASAHWTSPWMQIEAGMAIGAGLPVLVVAESDVTEGVFEPGTWSGAVFGTSSDDISSAAVEAWSVAVIAFSRGRERLAD